MAPIDVENVQNVAMVQRRDFARVLEELVDNLLARLETAASAFDAAAKTSTVTSEEINKLLYTSERLLTRDEGLDGRTWYKHHIYAPGFYTGYGVKTIPGVREAIEQREYDQVEPQIEIAAGVLDKMSERIEQVTRALE